MPSPAQRKWGTKGMANEREQTTDFLALSAAQWAGKHVLITGGAGFIGSTLAIRLCEQAANVTVVDCLIPEYGGNLFNLNGYHNKISIINADIRDGDLLASLLQKTDILFSLAGQTSHMDSMQNPTNDLSINCSAQLKLLEKCRLHNRAIRIVYASTRQIYGRPLYLPVDEVHPISPVDINGIHKVAAEWYYKLYDDVHGIRSCSLRLTNTIGPRMRIKDARQTFLGIWIKMLLENKPIEVWGGEQLRDFNDVEDVVDAMMIAAFHDGASGNVFNLGSEEVVSLKELAQLMITIKGDGKFSITPYPEDRKPIDIGDYYGSFEKFSSVTGWRPTRKLAHTLERTLDYYGKNFQHYVEDAAPYRS
jgi:UDP-glucose 4-epimerase